LGGVASQANAPLLTTDDCHSMDAAREDFFCPAVLPARTHRLRLASSSSRVSHRVSVFLSCLSQPAGIEIVQNYTWDDERTYCIVMGVGPDNTNFAPFQFPIEYDMTIADVANILEVRSAAHPFLPGRAVPRPPAVSLERGVRPPPAPPPVLLLTLAHRGSRTPSGTDRH